MPYAEIPFSLMSRDGFRIYGIHNTAKAGETSERLMILSHGLTGNPNSYLFKQAQRYFNERGYDVVRFAYYDARADARHLKQCTLAIHGEDLNLVCNHFRPHYSHLLVAGHSYGGLAILHAQPKASALAFWDSSFQPFAGFWEKEADYQPLIDMYVLHWESDHLIGRAMYEEARNLTLAKAQQLAQAIKLPSLVAIASDDPRRASRIGLYDALPEPKTRRDIGQADHGFTAGESIFALLDATDQWFKAIIA